MTRERDLAPACPDRERAAGIARSSLAQVATGRGHQYMNADSQLGNFASDPCEFPVREPDLGATRAVFADANARPAV
jgi:hypothetical protein